MIAWQKVIPQNGSFLQQTDILCELHFKEEEVLREWAHEIDGQIVMLPKDKVGLKIGSVPTIFPNLENYPPENHPPDNHENSMYNFKYLFFFKVKVARLKST